MPSLEHDREAALADVYAALQHVIIEALEGYSAEEIMSMRQIERITTIIQYSAWLTTRYAYTAGMTQNLSDWASGEWSGGGWIPGLGAKFYHDVSRMSGMPAALAAALTSVVAAHHSVWPMKKPTLNLPGGLVQRLKSFIPEIQTIKGGGGMVQQLKALKEEP